MPPRYCPAHLTRQHLLKNGWPGGIGGLFHFAVRSTRLRLRLTRQSPLRGGRRSPNSFSVSNFRYYCIRWVLLFWLFIFIFDVCIIDENDFLDTSTPAARRGITTYVQKADPTPAAAKGRWCNLATALTFHTPNETSSYFLEDLVVLPQLTFEISRDALLGSEEERQELIFSEHRALRSRTLW